MRRLQKEEAWSPSLVSSPSTWEMRHTSRELMTKARIYNTVLLAKSGRDRNWWVTLVQKWGHAGHSSLGFHLYFLRFVLGGGGVILSAWENQGQPRDHLIDCEPIILPEEFLLLYLWIAATFLGEVCLLVCTSKDQEACLNNISFHRSLLESAFVLLLRCSLSSVQLITLELIFTLTHLDFSSLSQLW